MSSSSINERTNETAPTSPTLVTLVESEACHFCADAHLVLDDLAIDYPLVVETLDVRSEPGRRLMALHRAAMSPLVLIDGAFFSSGRLPRRKLATHLTRRYGVPTAARSAHSGGRRG